MERLLCNEGHESISIQYVRHQRYGSSIPESQFGYHCHQWHLWVSAATRRSGRSLCDIMLICSSSISIACWVVVFSPQIIENFRRGSADGLSLQFIIVWLAGDVFNILGAVLQGVLPTMVRLTHIFVRAQTLIIFRSSLLSTTP